MYRKTVIQIIPGIILAAAVTSAGFVLSWIVGLVLPFEVNPVSPMLVTIILGLVIKNSIVLPDTLKPGIGFGIKKLLRFGIILMGIRVSIISIAQIGVTALGLVVVCIIGAILIVHVLAKLLHISPRLGALIAAGTSICGVSAVIAVSPAVGASEDETAYAVGTITLFGLAATAIYPYLIELVLHLDMVQAGFFLGTSIHDTSQVTAASLIYNELWGYFSQEGLTGADIAVTTKLVRNTLMAAVIPVIGIVYNKTSSSAKKISLASAVPLFVLGYIAMGGVRFAGDLFFPGLQVWNGFVDGIASVSGFVIATAIACVGLNTHLKSLKRIGYKPFLIGLIAAVSLGVISYSLITIFSRYLII